MEYRYMKQKMTTRQQLDKYLLNLKEKTGIQIKDNYEEILLILEAANAGEFSSQTLFKNIFPAFIEQNINGDLLNRYRKIRSIKGITLEKLILINGEDVGKIKWDEYRTKQAITNTFDYKNKKYGMTKDEFIEYNKNRASTKKNFIKKYGEEDGLKKWNAYCKKQSYVGIALEYFIEKYGEVVGTEVYNDVNRKKSNSIDGFIRRYGEDRGIVEYENYMNVFSKSINVSKNSQTFFDEIVKFMKIMSLDTNNLYYKNLNREFGKLDVEKRRYYFYDFVSTSAKVVVEYNGDIYHANPISYNEHDVPPFRGNKRTANEIWTYDKEKQDFIASLGFYVIIVWESDVLKDMTYHAKRIASEIADRLNSNIKLCD